MVFRRWIVCSVVVMGLVLAMPEAQGAGASQDSYPPVPSSAGAAPPGCSGNGDIHAVPADQVSATEKSIEALAGSRLGGIGLCGNGLIFLTLAPGSEAVAHAVRAKFGPSVQIKVGLTVWNGRPGRSPKCGTLPKASTAPSDYAASLKLGSAQVKSGANFHGVVVFKDTASRDVRVDTEQPVEVVLTKLHTRRVVGVFSEGVAGTALGFDLSPGKPQSVGIVGGTARCDGGIGSALPPGHYDALAEVSGVAVDGTGGSLQLPPTYFTSVEPIVVVPS